MPTLIDAIVIIWLFGITALILILDDAKVRKDD
jgi:hypothetical protein